MYLNVQTGPFSLKELLGLLDYPSHLIKHPHTSDAFRKKECTLQYPLHLIIQITSQTAFIRAGVRPVAQWRILDQIMLSGLRLYLPVVFPAPPNPCLNHNLLLSSACLLEGLLPACLPGSEPSRPNHKFNQTKWFTTSVPSI